MTTPILDIAALRAEFPILKREAYGKPLVYLDNAASAQKPRAVIDAMKGAMEGSYANVHRGLHLLANEATTAFEAARKTAAKFLNAASPDEIVFTAGGTIENIRVVRGLPDGLTEKAIEAAKRIRFQPAVKNGSPVSVRGNLEFTFNLY